VGENFFFIIGRIVVNMASLHVDRIFPPRGSCLVRCVLILFSDIVSSVNDGLRVCWGLGLKEKTWDFLCFLAPWLRSSLPICSGKKMDKKNVV